MDIVTYKLGKTYTNKAVAGFSSVYADDETSTIHFTLVDGQQVTLHIPKPRDGISIENITINEDNDIIFQMSDNTEINAGPMPAPEIALSETEGNAIQKKDDGLYVSSTGVIISQEPDNGIQNTANGLYSKKATFNIKDKSEYLIFYSENEILGSLSGYQDEVFMGRFKNTSYEDVVCQFEGMISWRDIPGVGDYTFPDIHGYCIITSLDPNKPYKKEYVATTSHDNAWGWHERAVADYIDFNAVLSNLDENGIALIKQYAQTAGLQNALTSHIEDTIIHISADERTQWNKNTTDISTLKSSVTGAMHFRGYAKNPINDNEMLVATEKGSRTEPLYLTFKLADNTTITLQSGDVIIYEDKEYIFRYTEQTNFNAKGVFNEFGSTGSLKALAFLDTASSQYTPEGTVELTAHTNFEVVPVKAIVNNGYTPSLTTSVENERLYLHFNGGSMPEVVNVETVVTGNTPSELPVKSIQPELVVDTLTFTGKEKIITVGGN